jgi:hypothetical protein
MHILTPLLASTIAIGTASAFAQDSYVRVGGGYVLSSDADANVVSTFNSDDLEDELALNTPDIKFVIEDGFSGSLVVGKMFGRFGIEAEVRHDELSFENQRIVTDFSGFDDFNDDDDVPLVALEDTPALTATDDDFSSTFVMANVVATFDEASDVLTPYVAAGAGVGFHDFLGDDATELAYQVKLGVARDFGGIQGGLEFAYLAGGEVSPDVQGVSQIEAFGGDGTFTSQFIDFNVPINRTSLRVFIGKSF